MTQQKNARLRKNAAPSVPGKSANTTTAAPAAIGQEPVTMTSLDLVDFINEQRKDGEAVLRHDHFMAKVPKVLSDAAPNFLGTDFYANGTGARIERSIYILPKREACLMAMSYSYELQAKVFDRMTALEANQAPAFFIPTSLAGALRLAAEQAEQLEQQQAALALAAPKVEFVDRYVAADTGDKGFREVCKLLQVKEPSFRAFLKERGVMYLLGGAWAPYAEHIAAGRFSTKTGVADHGDTSHAYSQHKFTPKGVAWIAGLWEKECQRLAEVGGA